MITTALLHSRRSPSRAGAGAAAPTPASADLHLQAPRRKELRSRSRSDKIAAKGAQLCHVVRIVLDPASRSSTRPAHASLPGEQDLPDQGKRHRPDPKDVTTQIAQIRRPEHQSDRLPLDQPQSRRAWPVVAQVLGGHRSTPSASRHSERADELRRCPRRGRPRRPPCWLHGAHNLKFKTFAVSGGDPTQYGHQPRQGFREDPGGHPGRSSSRPRRTCSTRPHP